MQGKPKQLLAYGERKSLANERVTFVPGSQEEIALIVRIFREFADERRSPNSIAARLNRDGITYLRDHRSIGSSKDPRSMISTI